MSEKEMKIAKSSTKEALWAEILRLQDEENTLHTEITTLNKDMEGMAQMNDDEVAAHAEEVKTLNKNIENLENLAKQDGKKKRALIERIAGQAADIELAKKKTEKYAELKTELEAKGIQLVAVQEKLEKAEEELVILRSRALPPASKKGTGEKGILRFFNIKTYAFALVFFIALGLGFGTVYYENLMYTWMNIKSRSITMVNPVAAMNFEKTDGIVIARHKDGEKLQTKDGVMIDDSIIIKWASKAGFDGILFGRLTNFKGQLNVEGIGTKRSEFSEIWVLPFVGIDDIAARLKVLGCSNVLALVDNEHNLTLPAIFTNTSEGKLEVFESRRMVAGFVPVFWGKDKQQMNIKSDNVYAHITSEEIFMEVKDIKASTSLVKE